MSAHDIPEDARRFGLLVAIYERLQETDVVNHLPNGTDDIAPGQTPDAAWDEADEVVLVFRAIAGDTEQQIGGTKPETQIQVILEWSTEYHDEAVTFWHQQVFDAVDDALDEFSPGQYIPLGGEGGADAQADDGQNRYLADRTYRYRTILQSDQQTDTS